MGSALNQLRLMNLTFSTLFHDLDGAAREANLSVLIEVLKLEGPLCSSSD